MKFKPKLSRAKFLKNTSNKCKNSVGEWERVQAPRRPVPQSSLGPYESYDLRQKFTFLSLRS